jgi:hypothetical protein
MVNLTDEIIKESSVPPQPPTTQPPINSLKTKIGLFLSKILSAILTALKTIFSLTNIKKFFVWTWTKLKSIFIAMKTANKATWIKWAVGFGLIMIVGGIVFGIFKCNITEKVKSKYELIAEKSKTKELKKNNDLIDIIDQVNDTIK